MSGGGGAPAPSHLNSPASCMGGQTLPLMSQPLVPTKQGLLAGCSYTGQLQERVWLGGNAAATVAGPVWAYGHAMSKQCEM
jgi:hypothetical protein